MIDADFVIASLEQATATLMAMPSNADRLGVKVCDYGFVADVERDERGFVVGDVGRGKLLSPAPSAADITRMDKILPWFSIIPQSRFVLRRIVALRSLTKLHTGKHAYSWGKLAEILKADWRAVKVWHAEGIAIIVNALNSGEMQ